MSRFPNVRAELRGVTAGEVLKRVPTLGHVAAIAAVTVLAMRDMTGAPITPAMRDEMLSRCAAGQYVELEIDLLAYEQAPGGTNRNYVRVRDGAMMGLGRTGVGRPFLRDHRQGDALARGGTITASATTKRGEGEYAIVQTARLTAPWMVDLALRGLLDGVSIGLNPTGPIECSVCNAPVFTVCWHCPGDRLALEGEGKTARLVDKPDGNVVVEFVFTAAELVETSVVSVPAVAGAHIEGIRAALAAGLGFESGEQPPELRMNKFATIATLLGLAATVGEDEVTNAVKEVVKERDLARSELGIAETENVKLSTEIEGYKKAESKVKEDAFINGALSTGRIAVGDADAWRDLYQLDSTRATERMSKRKAGCATPVGLSRQSDKDDGKGGTVTADGSTKSGEVRTTLEANGVNADAAMKFAKAFGAKQPEKTFAKALGLDGEV